MTFTESDIIFPSKKDYEEIKQIDNTILSLFYIHLNNVQNYHLITCSSLCYSKVNFDMNLDEIENNIKTIKKKIKITELEPNSFCNNFPALTHFICEASILSNWKRNITQYKYYNIAVRLNNLLDFHPQIK